MWTLIVIAAGCQLPCETLYQDKRSFTWEQCRMRAEQEQGYHYFLGTYETDKHGNLIYDGVLVRGICQKKEE